MELPMNLIAKFKILKWEEQPYSEVDHAGKLSLAEVEFNYIEGVIGQGRVNFLMSYDSQGKALYCGFERIQGEIAGKTGSFVLRHQGVFANGEIDQQSSVVSDSGTADFSGISGKGALKTGHQEEHAMELELNFAAQ
jgi:hypothetical protein